MNQLLSLREITMDNFRECIRLPLSEEQRGYVASNMYSLAEAKADGISVPLAIYADDTMVGFVMYWYDEDNGKGYIDRLMVTTDHQGHGYGTFALKEVIERFRQTPGCTHIQISWHAENVVAERLYHKLGFVNNGEFVEGEVVAILDLT